MNHKVLPPTVAKFLSDMRSSATHYRMLHIGIVLAQVSMMFQLQPDDEVPDEAAAMFYLLFKGLESGNPVEYASCHARAMAIYAAWNRNGGIH